MNNVLQHLHNSIHFIDDITAFVAGQFQRADVSIFHQFAPPPTGGGHQFLRGLWREFEARGLKVENNSLSSATRACLFNSFNFDDRRLRRLRRPNVMYVHRVDGPIDTYRGREDGVDRSIWQVNQEFADATIFQSQYSLNKHLELGLQFKNPVVIPNAADPMVFHSKNRITFSRARKIRIISASWSDNPNKGASVYQWLDEHLNFEQFEYTFVGRIPVALKNIQTHPPVTSIELAALLREHDIYLTASRYDPCSNSLIEALSCGLPAIYLKSGGHPELAQDAGFGFDSAEEIPMLLNKLVIEYEARQGQIIAPQLGKIAAQYLNVLGFEIAA